MFEKDISQLSKPEIKGRGFIGSGKEIIETQTYYTQPENKTQLFSINLSNCWNSILIKNTNLKPFKLQHKDETSLNANATKVEKIKRMTYGRFGESCGL